MTIVIKVILTVYIIIALSYFLGNISCYCVKGLRDRGAFRSNVTSDELFEEYARKYHNNNYMKAGLRIILESFLCGMVWPYAIYLVAKYWDRL